jgi:hypothetical protein
VQGATQTKFGPGLGGLACVQEEERNGRKLMQAIMIIILNSLYITFSFREKLKVSFDIITKRK